MLPPSGPGAAALLAKRRAPNLRALKEPNPVSAVSAGPPSSPWRATVVTLFPGLFPGPLGASLAGAALEQGLWALDTISIRDFGIGRHKQVDDTPAGGGVRHGDAR